MIIDVHAHIGHWETGDFTPQYVVRLMRDSGVDLALISNLDGARKDQAEANERTRQAVLAYPDELRGLVWVNPWLADRALDNAIKCLDWGFVGLKFHPFHNRFYFNSRPVEPFLRLAARRGVPVAVHTAYDPYSHPDQVAAVGGDFPAVQFILYHAGLNPPDAETGTQALRLAASQPNLYVDISWLDLGRLRQALDLVPTERILFGTDLPLGGDEHYRGYFEKVETLGLSEEQRALLLEGNARYVFELS